MNLAINPGLKRNAANRKRLDTMAFLRRENLRLANALEQQLEKKFDRLLVKQKLLPVPENLLFQSQDKDEKKVRFIDRLIGNLRGCSSKGVFAVHQKDRAVSFIGAHTCKHKLCCVCNYDRSKKMRRKYYNHFEQNEELRENYDFFHLTLTVPHSEKGFRGKKIYLPEINKAFNLMRKYAFWKESVYGGELTVEFTKQKNGLHIHIHALVLVHKYKGNRNHLFAEILRAWNGLTIDPGATRQIFGKDDMEGLKRSLAHLDDQEFEYLFKRLDPRGATILGFEGLYVTSSTPKRGYFKTEKGNYKKRISANKPKELLAGILECLKYHFEPFALGKGNNWNTNLIMELGLLLHGKPLYRKFGKFYGVKALNISEEPFVDEGTQLIIEQVGSELKGKFRVEDVLYDLEKSAPIGEMNDRAILSEVLVDRFADRKGIFEDIIHPWTGEYEDVNQFQFVMADVGLASVRKRKDDHKYIALKGGQMPLPAGSPRAAMMIMTQLMIQGSMEKRKFKGEAKSLTKTDYSALIKNIGNKIQYN